MVGFIWMLVIPICLYIYLVRRNKIGIAFNLATEELSKQVKNEIRGNDITFISMKRISQDTIVVKLTTINEELIEKYGEAIYVSIMSMVGGKHKFKITANKEDIPLYDNKNLNKALIFMGICFLLAIVFIIVVYSLEG